MLTTISVVNVELTGIGLFLTLGKMTPRFLVVDLWELEDVEVIGVVADGVFDGEATDEVDEAVGIEDVDVVTVVGVVGFSVENSSFNPTYLQKKKEKFKNNKNITQKKIFKLKITKKKW